MHRLFALALVLASSACVSTSKEYPVKSFYAFEVARPERVEAALDAPVLFVPRFRSSPVQQGNGLVYRTGASKYESDYYAEYFTDPEGLLTFATSSWFSDSGLFSVVVASEGDVRPDYLLHGTLKRLYVDVTGDGDPRAVVELQLFLAERDGPHSEPVWNGDFRRVEPADGPSGDAVMGAWNRALADLFTEAEAAIAGVLAAAR